MDTFSFNKIDASIWADEIDMMVTVCDINGTIVYMNKAAALGFYKYGGYDLTGKSVFDCHNPKSVIKIKELLN